MKNGMDRVKYGWTTHSVTALKIVCSSVSTIAIGMLTCPDKDRVQERRTELEIASILTM